MLANRGFSTVWYSTKVIRFIRKRNKPGSHPGLISFKNIHKHTDNPTITELNSLRNYNNAIGGICQVGKCVYCIVFLKNRGSPPNLRSIQYPVILPSERQNIFYIRIWYCYIKDICGTFSDFVCPSGLSFLNFSVSDLQYLSLLYRLYNGFIAFYFWRLIVFLDYFKRMKKDFAQKMCYR